MHDPQSLTEAPWSLEPGATIEPYQRPSRFEKDVVRTVSNPSGQPSASGARTPHHLVNGTITPNGLHFVVVYGGAPDIDPVKHRLAIHGLVKRPLVFTLDALARYQVRWLLLAVPFLPRIIQACASNPNRVLVAAMRKLLVLCFGVLKTGKLSI